MKSPKHSEMQCLALLGASSQIAKDLIRSVSVQGKHDLILYVRNVAGMNDWLKGTGLEGRFPVLPYSAYGELEHDAVINFVGVGDPSRAQAMAGEIIELTLEFDQLVLQELKTHPRRRYLFLSSGAVYGCGFEAPVDGNSQALVPINDIGPENYYSVAKLHAEVRHRSWVDFCIVDIRVFNYFSRYIDLKSRFFISDVVNAIIDRNTLCTSADLMVRDFLHPMDFYRLIDSLLNAPAQNIAIDCYSKAPIEKFTLLNALKNKFGLAYEVTPDLATVVNATGTKPSYFSSHKIAAAFGYEPHYSSLEGLITEISALLECAG